MKRRSFINSIILSTGALFAGTNCTGKKDSEANLQEDNNLSDNGFVHEPSKPVPVADSAEVLIIGGGPSGVAAATAAARAGSSVILVERYNHLGGLWTGGLVLPLLATHAINRNNKQVRTMAGIGMEINERLQKLNMSIHKVNPVVDPEATKYVLEVMLKEAGVKVWYHCWASNVLKENDQISAVILESKSGRIAVKPKIVIDCTGDGDIMHLSGEEYDVMNYEIGLVHRLGNVDRINKNAPGYVERNLGGATPLKSVNWVNMTGNGHNDALDFKLLSQLQRDHRIEIWNQVEEIRKTPGHEEVFLLDTAAQQGVRMSRMLKGQYELTLEDSLTYKEFDDCIGLGGAWISQVFNGKRIAYEERPLWQIPFRSLVPKNTANLLVAGRCFSFKQDLFQDARVIANCIVTGQGAGVGAAEAVRSGSSVAELDIKQIQKTLQDQNVLLDA